MNQKKINGKMYNEYGPIYCPNGTSWDDLQKEVRLRRLPGNSVRVIKKPIKSNEVNRNTHEVWMYVRYMG